MSTGIVGALQEKQEALKGKENELRQLWLAAGDDREGLKKRAEISTKLRAVQAEQVGLGPRIMEAKEQGKAAARERILASAEYKAAVTTAAAGLAELLRPWLPLLALTLEARKQAVTAPSLPQGIGQMYVEGKGWLKAMVKAGVLEPKRLPAALAGLVREGQ